VAQVVEHHLASKGLSSNPNAAKRKEQRERGRGRRKQARKEGTEGGREGGKGGIREGKKERQSGTVSINWPITEGN
jgi:hypothetical protein